MSDAGIHGWQRGAAPKTDPEPMVGFIQAVVASAFDVAPQAIREPRRGSAHVAFARQIAVYLVCTRLGVSYSAAGRLFGRDRTTAAHACRLVEERREELELDTILDCLERAIDLWRRDRKGLAAQ